MEYRHELINFSNNLPMKFFLHKIGNVPMHWHRSLELLYCAEGKAHVVIGKEEYAFEKGGLLLVNSNIPHRLQSDAAVLLAVQLKPELLNYISAKDKPVVFDCICPSGSGDNGKFFSVKQILALILHSNIESQRYIDCLNTALCYRLIYELYANFAVTDRHMRSEYQLSERLTVLLSYINANYDKDLPLEELAGKLYLSVPYFSKFFKQNMGMTCGDYIKSIRLNHATEELQNTNDSVEKIGERCGFSNTRSFVDAFREKTGVTPSVWKKQTQEEKKSSSDLYRKDQETGYFNTDASILFSSISDFLKKFSDSWATTAKIPAEEEHILVLADCRLTGKPLLKRYLGFIGVSHIRELLSESVRRELAEAQRLIGFSYVKCHSVFDDCMMVYSRMNGKSVYNFNLIDDAYDFLLSVGLKPLVQLSFMPSALAKNPEKTTFYNKMITSSPNDMREWNNLVRAFAVHLINRYGEKEVCTWLFSVWNEPNTSEFLFGFRTESEYFDLYKNSFRTLKNVNANLRVGGPSAFLAYGKSSKWIFKFLDWSKANGCLPDFFDVHYYDVDMSQPKLLQSGRRIVTPLSPKPSAYADFLKDLENTLHEKGYGGIPVTVSEWNSTTSHRDPLSDTCFKSCYIVKNQLDALTSACRSGYWLLTDCHSEILQNDKIFHGGLGMFTVNGIKKPSFFAYAFLSQLKNIVLLRGDGYIVTKDYADEITVLLYNYFHYSPAYAQEVGINTAYTDRYAVFPDKSARKFDLELCVPQKNYVVTQSYVNRSHGSVFDEFVRMGAVEPLTRQETEYLSAVVCPALEKSVVQAEHDKLCLSATLEPLEIRLIHIKPVV